MPVDAIFGVSPQTVSDCMKAALSKGGSYSDVYFERSRKWSCLLADRVASSVRADTDFGAGVRVVDGLKTGYAYTQCCDHASLMAAAESASAISSKGGGNAPCTESFSDPLYIGRYDMQAPWSQHLPIECLKTLDELIFSRDSSVLKFIARLNCSEKDILFYNSLGTRCSETRPLGSITAYVIMSKNGRTESFSCSRSWRMGREMISDSLLSDMADTLIEGGRRLFESDRPSSGRMPVVFAPGISGILLHEAIGHAFEADMIRKNTSVFSGKMGEMVANPIVSVVDDGTIYGNRGALSFEDEGVAGQKTYMVREGRLESYLHDRISAAHFGVEPTGNGRRENFRFAPIPRMRCTYMEAGDSSLEQLIGGVDKGIYVDNISNGQVNIGQGDVTFYVKTGYMIENGRLTRPIKDTNIIGNGPQALADIIGVGDTLVVEDSATICGKGQSVAVGCGMPAALVRELNVGGLDK